MPAITTLTLSAFRSYSHLQIAGQAGLIALTGVNGAGKTNILEAISLLTAGRGLRGAKLGDIQQFGAVAPWAVHAHLQRSEDDRFTLATGRDPAAAEETSTRRVVLIDGVKSGQPALNEHLAVSWLTPAMDRLWAESPATRRRFLDRLTAALFPAHNTHVNRYEDTLAERNRLLKEGRIDPHWFSSLEHQLATEGMAIAAARRDVVNALAYQFQQTENQSFPAPLLALEGVEAWLDDTPALLAEDKLREALAQSRRQDALSGSTSLGVHRTDLLAVHPEKNMPAALCSTGEQKALLVSLVLAHAEVIRAQRGEAPILLLDEVGAHLDEGRRLALFKRLRDLNCQCWMTGADLSLFPPMGEILCYHIADGRVAEITP